MKINIKRKIQIHLSPPKSLVTFLLLCNGVQLSLEITSWTQKQRNKLGKMEFLKGSSQLSTKSSSSMRNMAQMFGFDYTPLACTENHDRHNSSNAVISCFTLPPDSDWSPLQVPPCPCFPALPTAQSRHSQQEVGAHRAVNSIQFNLIELNSVKRIY